jgi:uncharacterized alpha-E superfamily protein
MSVMPDKSLRVPVVLELPVGASARPVLARDADATYWMSRYVERAEHVARLLMVNGDASLDVADLGSDILESHWKSVLKIMAVDGPAASEMPLPESIIQYMAFDYENPNSLIRCLTRARENARGIREVISTEMWEQLNMLYWSIRGDEAAAIFRESPEQLYQQIITGSMLFQGLTDQTLVHGQRWFFAQLGKYFERIIFTTRILKNKFEMLRDGEYANDAPLANIQWLAALRTCGSEESYRRTYLGDLDAINIAQFLILEQRFPRSIRYCVRQAHRSIAAIRAAVRSHTVDPTERILGRLDAQLEYASPADLMNSDLPKYLTGIFDNIAAAAIAVQRSFFLH